MRFTQRLVALGAGAVVIAGGAVTGVQTASASDSASLSGKVVVEATGAYTGALVNGLTVVADCSAVAVGAVSAVVLDRCYLTNQSANHPGTGPGNVATSAFTTTENSLDFKLCWHAYAIPLTDPLHPATTSGCTSGLVPGSLGGGGVSVGQN